MKLHSYTNEIINIGTENGMGWHEGASMFLANVRNAGDKSLPHYAGAESVDYIGLKAHVDELAGSAQQFVEDYRANQSEIIRLRREGKYDEVTALMEAAGEAGTEGEERHGTV